MAQFTIYRSADANAPVLNGLAGSLITVLDAILVNGYGTRPSASWTKSFSSGSYYAAYKQGSGSNGCYMWVQDTGSVASGKDAIFRGFENLSSISGTTLYGFPNVLQSALTSTGLAIRKSSVVTISSIPWVAAADSRTLYFFAQTGDTAATYVSFMFGDIYSYIPNDPYRCMIIGKSVENAAGTTNDAIYNISYLLANQAGNYIQRSFTGTGTSTPCGKHVDGWKNGSNSTTMAASTFAYPNPTDNKIYLSPVWVTENSVLRGHLRGFYNLGHVWTIMNDGDTFSGSIGTEMAGKTFLAVKSPGYIIETSNTVDTN